MSKTEQAIICNLRQEIRIQKRENTDQKREITRLKKENGELKRRTTNLDSILDNQGKLHAMTRLDRGEFDWVLTRFQEAVKNSEHAPRFSEYCTDKGKTCMLPVRHVLFLALIRKSANPTQEVLAAIANTDQSTISRYLSLADSLLQKTLPTPDNIGEAIRNARTPKEVKKFMPGKGAGEMYTDGTHVQVERPAKDQKKLYSGKKKRHTYNQQITSNRDSVILDTGKTEDGSIHDIAMLRDNPPKFGKWTDRMMNPNTPNGKRITVYTDKGYAGIESIYPGIISRQPIKRSRNRSLTESDEEYSRRISRRRTRAGHAICRLKCFRRMSSAYDDTKKRFREGLQVCAGLVNLHIMLNDRRYGDLLPAICP